MRAQFIRPPAPARSRLIAPKNRSQRHLARLCREWTTHRLFDSFNFFDHTVLTLRGLVTYYVLFSSHLETRGGNIAEIPAPPDEPWMKQIARNVTLEGCGTLRDCRYLLHDRDTKYTQSFRSIIASGRVEPLV